MSGLFWRYSRTTLEESLVGFGLGAMIALPLGYGIAQSRILATAFQPYIAASQALPAVALAPILTLWFGYGLKSIALLCALIVFFPMVINTAVGIRSVDEDVIGAAKVDGAGFWSLLWSIQAPLASPIILAGMRTSLTLSITGAVVGEFVLGDRGARWAAANRERQFRYAARLRDYCDVDDPGNDAVLQRLGIGTTRD